jgi:hypothetical protein
MVRTVGGLEMDALHLTSHSSSWSPHLCCSPSCGGGEEKLVRELEEATFRKNRGVLLLHCSRQLPVQSSLFQTSRER